MIISITSAIITLLLPIIIIIIIVISACDWSLLSPSGGGPLPGGCGAAPGAAPGEAACFRLGGWGAQGEAGKPLGSKKGFFKSYLKTVPKLQR